MIKVYIGETEVLSNKTFTITEELLKTSSTILNNCYPKCWEATRDYTNRFFFPKDYSQCKIQDEEYFPNIPGITVSSQNASLTLTNVDITKQMELTNIQGNTTQNGTPTPSSPQPINVVSGRQEITISNGTDSQSYEINLGKNLFNPNNFITKNNVSMNNQIISSTGMATTSWGYTNRNWTGTLQAGTYQLSVFFSALDTNVYPSIRVYNSSGTELALFGNLKNTSQKTVSLTLTEETEIGIQFKLSDGVCTFQIEKGSIATTYAPYKTPIELCKIGNYQDFIKKGTGKNLCQTETNNSIISTLQAGTYTFSLYSTISGGFNLKKTNGSGENITSTQYISANNRTSVSFTLTEETQVFINGYSGTSGTTFIDGTNRWQLETGSTASSYEPYGMYNKWYIEKQTGKVVLNGTEEGWNVRQGNNPNLYIFYLLNNLVQNSIKESGGFSNYFIENTTSGLIQYDGGFRITEYNSINRVYLCVNNNIATTIPNFKTWLGTHNTELYYPLATQTYTEITDSELISQLNSLELLEGLNNISITSGDLPGEITIHYNYQEEHTDIDLLFCGVVKNSGDISLRPTDPKFCSLQILDYKALLSEGQSLDFVISNKTIEEAINMIIDAISDYGFIVGNISLSNGDETIGSYSTLNKTPYDVFQYLADISQSKWFTRVIDEDTVAIDFYSPELMERANDIQYTEEYFRENNIIDLSFSFGTRDYRNKQTILSDKVYGEIESDENITANGYQTSYETSGVIGILNHIYVNGVEKTIGTATEKNLGIYADFYYTPGNSTIEASNNYIAGTTIRALYTPLVKGRQIVYNNSEINRINNQTGRNGIIARYETRNDILSSNELNQVAQTYIQYKGTPEIILTVQTKDKDLFNIGQQVYFDMPDVPDLSTDYMVKNKEIEITKTGESGVVFYTYQLSSNYNSETAINYFDNQRNKTNGNISEDEFITRNIDIESTANIIFDNLSVEEITLDGNNTLNCVLNSPFTQ